MPKVTQYVDKQLFVCDILNNFWHIPLFKQIIMKYKLFSLFFMLLLPISGHAQNATILFSTEQDCEISIYEPIDGGYNNQLPTTILKVTTNKPCIYSTDIVSFNFIYCQFSQGTKCEVILFPNDSLKIHINNKQITFEGSNQDGLEYLQDKFTNASHYFQQFYLLCIVRSKYLIHFLKYFIGTYIIVVCHNCVHAPDKCKCSHKCY